MNFHSDFVVVVVVVVVVVAMTAVIVYKAQSEELLLQNAELLEHIDVLVGRLAELDTSSHSLQQSHSPSQSQTCTGSVCGSHNELASCTTSALVHQTQTHAVNACGSHVELAQCNTSVAPRTTADLVDQTQTCGVNAVGSQVELAERTTSSNAPRLRAPPRMACSAVKSGGRQRYSWNCFPSTAGTGTWAPGTGTWAAGTDSSAAVMSSLLPRQASCSQKLLVNCAAYMITDTAADIAATHVDSGGVVSRPPVTADTTADNDIGVSPVTVDTAADNDVDVSRPPVTADTTADSDSDIAQPLISEYISEMSSACEGDDSSTSRTDLRLSFSDDECFIEVSSHNNNI